jgi:hypothetical protein
MSVPGHLPPQILPPEGAASKARLAAISVLLERVIPAVSPEIIIETQRSLANSLVAECKSAAAHEADASRSTTVRTTGANSLSFSQKEVDQ